MTEKELAQQIVLGDPKAAEAFAREHYPAVLRLATRLCGSLDEGQDIAQETFLVARQKIHTYRGGSSLRTWIHRIAFNEYKQWRRKRRPLQLSGFDRSANSSEISSFEDGYVLANALNQLPAKQREAFILFEVEQLSMNEVAHVLGIPSGTAKARVHYARLSLRRFLEEEPEVRTDELQQSTI